MWLDGKPTKVHATANSVKTNYAILKELLPIPMGIDHLKPEVLQQNKILKKMDLLNVGVINDIELENDQIKIKDAEITNPTIQQLYDDGELPYFSFVSNMFTTPCPTGEADAVEKYSIIGRVDFVEKGACESCRTGLNSAQASNSKYNAKAIIGDDKVAAQSQDPKHNQNQGNQGDQTGDGETEPTLTDVMEAVGKIAEGVETQGKAIVAIMGKLGLSEATPQQGQQQQQAAAGSSEGETDDEGGEGEASNSEDPRISKLENEVKGMKAEAAKTVAKGKVNGYIKEGKILPKDVESHLALAMAAPDKYDAIMKEAPKVIDLERHSQGGQGQASNSDATITDENGEEIDMKAANDEVNKIIEAEGE